MWFLLGLLLAVSSGSMLLLSGDSEEEEAQEPLAPLVRQPKGDFDSLLGLPTKLPTRLPRTFNYLDEEEEDPNFWLRRFFGLIAGFTVAAIWGSFI